MTVDQEMQDRTGPCCTPEGPAGRSYCVCCLPAHQQPTHACHCGHRWTVTGRRPE